MYQKDVLKKYIDDSVLIEINTNLRIRLSKQLEVKYNDGKYTNAINHFENYIEQISSLNLTYPGNAHPVFYVYLVPDKNFVDLLRFPYPERKGGGRPVSSFDIDGFNSAYGESQNLAANQPKELPNISRIVNSIHEFAHLVHSQYFSKNRFICEGFAEALPLYTLNYESKFDEHRNAIKNMDESQIFSAKQLLDMEKKNSFGRSALLPNKSCAFDLAYISSYLFVRSCLEIIASKFNINRAEATQKFLEIVRSSQCSHEWLVYDIANALDIPKSVLYSKKTIQINTLKDL
jgi:hypothetical protein